MSQSGWISMELATVQIDTILVNPDSLSELVIVRAPIDSLALFVKTNIPLQPEMAVLWTALAVLAAAFVPLFLSSLKTYSHQMGVMGSTLLIFRNLEQALDDHVPKLEKFSNDIRDKLPKSLNLPVHTLLAYDWPSNIPWQTVFDAARTLWSKSTDSIDYLTKLWRSIIAVSATYEMLQKMHLVHFEILRGYQNKFSSNIKEIIDITRRNWDVNGRDEKSIQFEAEIQQILRTWKSHISDPKNSHSIKDRHDFIIVPMASLCEQGANEPLSRALYLPIAECSEAHLNIEILGNVYSQNYLDKTGLLEENRGRISECLDGLCEERFRCGLVIPWFATYIGMRGRTLAWRRSIKNRFASFVP
jgi:hypothetical protein